MDEIRKQIHFRAYILMSYL